MTKDTSKVCRDGGSERLPIYLAIIKGTASFKSSDGWKRTKPRFSHRCAPLEASPKKSTPTSNTTPTKNISGAKDS